MELTFLGHATVCVQIDGVRVLSDPVLRSRVAFLRWTAPAPLTDLLGDVDAVVVSHLHHDHCDLPSLTLLGRDRRLVVPAGTEPFFRRHGFTNVVGLRVGESRAVGPVEITATEAAHDGTRRPFGPAGTAVGFLLAAGGLGVYFAGDTDLFPAMRGLAPYVDVALLPVAGWARTLGPGHLDPARAAEAARLLSPSLAVPVHWGALQPVWYRGRAEERSDRPAHRFEAEVRRRGLATEVIVLRPGERLAWAR